MKNIIYILLLAGLASCGTVKKTETHDTIIANNVSNDTATRADSVNDHEHSLIQMDTAVGVKGKEAELDFDYQQLEPVKTANGVKQSRYYHVDKNGIHVGVTKDTSGNIHIHVNTDSVTLFIRKITIEKDVWHTRFDSVMHIKGDSSHVVIQKDVSVKVTNHVPFMKAFWIGLVCFAFGVLVTLLVQAYLKHRV